MLIQLLTDHHTRKQINVTNAQIYKEERWASHSSFNTCQTFRVLKIIWEALIRIIRKIVTKRGKTKT